MRILCVFGQHNYGNPYRGEGYEYINMLPSLRRLGHEVLFLESWNRTYHSGFYSLNAALLRMVEEHRPAVVFAVLRHYEIWSETWEILRDAGIAATVNWTTDDSWKYTQFSRFVAPTFHACTTTYPVIYARYQQDGIARVLLTQWGANADRFQPPRSAAKCKYPVSFVGTAHGKRRAWVEALHRRGIQLECFGYGWPRGPVDSDGIFQTIHNSVISLNFANSPLAWDGILPRQCTQIKARIFEVPGAGGFLLTEWADGIDHYYVPGHEIATFRGLKELLEKIEYYLRHPQERDAIALAGYKRTVTDHTYDQRLAEVLDFAVSARNQYVGRSGLLPTGRIDWSRFEIAASHHIMDWKLALLKRALVAACKIIWGSTRGPRAARRLIFELSWRLGGARTYSALGWPGRMFYEVS